MTPFRTPDRLIFELIQVSSVDRVQWREIVDLCTTAYDEDFDALFRTLPGTTHILARLRDRLVSHACWVTRWLQAGSREPLRTAYVEAVATDPVHQGKGYASAVMEKVAEEIVGFDLGGLSTGRHSFYERLGWERWRGPLAIRAEAGLLDTPRDDAMVLRLPRTPELDLNELLTAEWREGELW